MKLAVVLQSYFSPYFSFLGSSTWILVAVLALVYLRPRSFLPVNLSYFAAFSTDIKPQIILRGVKGPIDEILSSLYSHGFIVFAALRVQPDGCDGNDDVSFVISAAASSKLLLKLASIYCTVEVNCASSLTPPVRTRLIRKSFALLSTICQGSDISFLHDQYGVEKVFEDELKSKRASCAVLNGYFGKPIASLFWWFGGLRTAVFPFVILWLLMMLSRQTNVTQLLGLMYSLVVSISLAYWKDALATLAQTWQILSTDDRHESIKELLLETTDESKKSLWKRSHSWIVCGLYVLFLVLLSWIVNPLRQVSALSMAAGLSVEAIYFCVATLSTVFVEHWVLSQIKSLSKNLLSNRKRWLFVAKQFLIRVAVVAVRFVWLLVVGSERRIVENCVTFLFICHLFLRPYIVSLVMSLFCGILSVYTLTTQSVDYRLGYSVLNCHALPLASKDHESIPGEVLRREAEEATGRHKILTRRTSLIHLSALIEEQKGDPETVRQRRLSNLRNENASRILYEFVPLDNHDRLLLEECSLPSYPTEDVLTELMVLIALSLLLSQFAPMVLPLTLAYLRFREDKEIAALLNSKRSALSEDGTLEPWLSLLELFSIVCLCANVMCLYFFSTPFSSSEDPICNEAKVGFCFPSGLRMIDNLLNLNGDVRTLSVVWLVMVEHLILLFRCVIAPTLCGALAGSEGEARKAMLTAAQFKENAAVRLHKGRHLSGANLISYVGPNVSSELVAQLELAEIQNREGKSMSPISFAAFSMLPYFLSHVFGVPWWSTILPLTLICGFSQNRIEREKKKAAISILSNPRIFQMIQKEIPGYNFGDETQRVCWVNTMLELTWSALVQYAYKKIRKILEPMLEKEKPAFMSKLKLSKLNLGTVPPKISGIRVFDGVPGQDHAEMEMDFNWVSNLSMALSINLGVGTDIVVDVSNFTFSGTVRMHMSPLIPAIPPFAVGKATFFEKPYVDFSLNFGDTDLTDGGNSSGNISSVVQRMLKTTLESMIVYPKWMQVEMLNDISKFVKTPIEPFTIAPPQGILCVNVLSASNLMIGDIFTSDPYVKLSLLDQVEYTKVVYKTLNPVWKDAQFTFLVHDKKAEFLNAQVWDKDIGSAGTYLGKVDLFINNLLEGVTKRYSNIQLLEVDHGTLTLELTYYAISGPKSDVVKLEEEATLSDLVGNYIEEYPNSFLTALGIDGETVNPLSADNVDEGPDSPRPTDVGNLGGIGKHTNPFKQFSLMGMSSRNVNTNLNVDGILTVSNISINKLMSAKSTVANPVYFAPFIVLKFGQVRRQTSIPTTKQPSFSLKQLFHFVVRDLESDVLIIKLKYMSPLGAQVTLASFRYRVSNVVHSIDSEMEVVEDVYRGRSIATGSLNVQLRYRSSTITPTSRRNS